MKAFFEGKKILITGHTGFKGTWLCRVLNNLDAKISGFSLPYSETDFYKSAQIEIRSHYGDIRNGEEIHNTIVEEQPEIIIHLASHSTINQGSDLTSYIFETNVMGVVNLFEAIRRTDSVKSVLVVTSDKCYRNLEMDEGYTEDYGFGAQDPYSASKAGQELVTECYRNLICGGDKRDLRIATARASNVIGGGDFNRTRLFPYIVECCLNGDKAAIRNPDAIRPWQNVIDVIGGYLSLIRAMNMKDGKVYCTAFNFGPERESFVKVREVVGIMKHIFPELECEITGVDSVKETKILKLDSTKAKKMLSWKPEYNLEETIKMTAAFEKKFREGTSAKSICDEFIKDYFERKYGKI